MNADEDPERLVEAMVVHDDAPDPHVDDDEEEEDIADVAPDEGPQPPPVLDPTRPHVEEMPEMSVEEVLELIRQNSPEVTSITPQNVTANKFCRLLGEALQNNTHVRVLDLLHCPDVQEGDNVVALIRFIETSQSLRTLLWVPKRFRFSLLHALTRRPPNTQLEGLALPELYAEHLVLYFAALLRQTPKIQSLGLLHGVCLDRHENFDDANVDPGTISALHSAAATANIERLLISGLEFPPPLLASFVQNPHLQHVVIIFFSVLEMVQDAGTLQTACELLRESRGGKCKVTIKFTVVQSWDRGVWLSLASALDGHDTVTEVTFKNVSVEDNFCVELFPKIFQGTRRKLRFGGGGAFIGGVEPSEGLIDVIAATTHEFEGNLAKVNSIKYFLSCLEKPTTVLESVHVGLFEADEAVDFEAFAVSAPNFTSVKVLTLEFVGRYHGSPMAHQQKQRVIKALWQNRSLVEKIELINFDLDREVLVRILQRNKALPALLEPQQLKTIDRSIWPYLFQLSGETNARELFDTIGSHNAVLFPDGSSSAPAPP